MGIVVWKLLNNADSNPYMADETEQLFEIKERYDTTMREQFETLGEMSQEFAEHLSKEMAKEVAACVLVSPGVLWPPGIREAYPASLVALVERLIDREAKANLEQVGGTQ